MDAKHTPGPWQFEDDMEGSKFHVAEDGCHVSLDADGEALVSDVRSVGRAIANARLIAAAPDLLLHLKILATWIERTSVMNRIGAVGEMLRDAKGAIEKAEKAEKATQ